MLSLVSFAGMTLNKCAVLWIVTLTGGPVQGESPLCWLKNTTVVLHDSSCKTDVYNQNRAHLLIILEREGVAV